MEDQEEFRVPGAKDLSLNIPNLKEAWRDDELNKMELHEVVFPGV